MNDYEKKQERRRARLEEKAAKARGAGNAALESARKVADGIPFGQPILVGHHSERRHRKDAERIDRGMQRGVDQLNRADALEARAAAVGSGGVSSDDPDAVAKLRAELVEAEAKQDRMRKANRAVRSKDPRAALAALGYDERAVDKLLSPDFAGRLGFADFELTNNNAKVRRLKKRIEELEGAAGDVTSERMVGEVQVIDNVEDNRLQLIFPSAPSQDARRTLRSYGFLWSPTAGAWQRKRGNSARFAAEQALKKIGGE